MSTTHISPPSSRPHTSDSISPSKGVNHRTATRTNSKDIERYRRKADIHLPELRLSTLNSSRSVTSGRLCGICNKIRFDRVMNTTIKELQSRRGRKDGVLIASLRARRHRKPITDCPLCHLLYIYVERSGYKGDTYQLRAFSYIHASKTIDFMACGKKVRRADILCLKIPHIEQQDYIFCLRKKVRNDRVITPLKLEPKASLSVCKEWLGYCQENHSVCNGIGIMPSHLRVIDCQSLEIIAVPPKASYIALSYVWGSTHETHESGFSRTIRDAIAVTKGLGYRYLWVDKHCIEQGDDNDKHHQIRQMDLVYQAADLTIIAAAGRDAGAGLPGILDTQRNHQPVVEIGDFLIINSMPHPHNTILKSKWSTRAWTLQEAVLSRRRLVFTPDQMYFECGAMNCCESLLEHRRLLHTRSKERAIRYCHSGIFSGRSENPFRSIEPRGAYYDISLLTALIEQYTARNLSYEQDSLNAFEGIFKRFCNPSFKHGYIERICRHIWGLPLVTNRFLGSLGSFKFNFFWRHQLDGDSIPTRRKAFPSWSWAGWSGAVVFTNPDPLTANLEKKIWLELEDSSRVSLEYVLLTFQPSDWAQLSQPHALRIKAKFVDTTELLIKPSTQCQSFSLGFLHGTFHWSIPQNNLTDLGAQFVSQEYEIMCIERPNMYSNVRNYPYLIVEWHLGFYSRVGVAEISGQPVLGKERLVQLR